MTFNILLVDDSKTVRTVITKALKISGFDTKGFYEASNGQEALDILEREWIDLIYTDINMPVMNGIEMVEIMSKNGLLESIPVVIISSDGSLTRIEQLRAKGISAFIRKPFTPESIKEITDEVLGLRDRLKKDSVTSSIFCKILEEFFFMFADEIEKEDVNSGKTDYIQANITLTGMLMGNIILTAHKEICYDLVANILGSNPNDEFFLGQAEDTFKELLSILAFNIITAMYGEKTVCNVKKLELFTISDKQWDKLRDDQNSICFKVDEFNAILTIKLEEN